MEQYSISDICILSDLGFTLTICNRFKDIPWDCDLYFSWWGSGSILPLIKAKLGRRPIVVIAGGTESVLYRDSISGIPFGYLDMPVYKKIATRIVLRFSTVVLVVSRFMVPHVKELSLGRAPILIPNCVDTSAFSPTNIEREFVTTISSISNTVINIKRSEVFVRAIPFVLARHPSQKFLWIGRKGDAYNQVLTLAESLGVTHALSFTDAISNNLVVNYLRRSKVYVQTSDMETFGVSVAEAMSTETPVVVSGVGGLPELTKGLGIVVDQNSEKSIATGIMEVLEMPEERRRNIGRECRRVIVDNFSYESRRAALSELIKRLV